MIGLVNAAGTPTTAHVEGTTRSLRERAAEQKATLAPILGAEEAAYKVLRSGVKSLSRPDEDPANRGNPGGDESDRFAQAELESRSEPAVGAQLDVTA